jgi:hypothetical protein
MAFQITNDPGQYGNTDLGSLFLGGFRAGQQVGRNIEETRKLVEERETRKAHKAEMEELNTRMGKIDEMGLAAKEAYEAKLELFAKGDPSVTDQDVADANADVLKAGARMYEQKMDLLSPAIMNGNPHAAKFAEILSQRYEASHRRYEQHLASEREERRVTEMETAGRSARQLAGQRAGLQEREFGLREKLGVKSMEADEERLRQGRERISQEDVRLGQAGERLQMERAQWDALGPKRQRTALEDSIGFVRALDAMGMSEDQIAQEVELPRGWSVADLMEKYKGRTEEDKARLTDVERRIKKLEAKKEAGEPYDRKRLQQYRQLQLELEEIDDERFSREEEMRQWKADRSTAVRAADKFKAGLATAGSAVGGALAFPFVFAYGLGVEGPSGQPTPEESVRSKAREEVGY